MIDTHCHLNDAKFDGEVETIVNNFKTVGIDKAICIAWDLDSSKKGKDIAQLYDCVYYTIGVHPDDCNKFDKQELIIKSTIFR